MKHGAGNSADYTPSPAVLYFVIIKYGDQLQMTVNKIPQMHLEIWTIHWQDIGTESNRVWGKSSSQASSLTDLKYKSLFHRKTNAGCSILDTGISDVASEMQSRGDQPVPCSRYSPTCGYPPSPTVPIIDSRSMRCPPRYLSPSFPAGLSPCPADWHQDNPPQELCLVQGDWCVATLPGTGDLWGTSVPTVLPQFYQGALQCTKWNMKRKNQCV